MNECLSGALPWSLVASASVSGFRSSGEVAWAATAGAVARATTGAFDRPPVRMSDAKQLTFLLPAPLEVKCEAGSCDQREIGSVAQQRGERCLIDPQHQARERVVE